MDSLALDIQAQVQAMLPPGFECHGAALAVVTGEDGEWFRMEFTYCDRHKFLSCRLPILPEDIAAQIVYTPILQDCPPDHYAAVARCLKKNPEYAMVADEENPLY
jgi:hypothetical protein